MSHARVTPRGWRGRPQAAAVAVLVLAGAAAAGPAANWPELRERAAPAVGEAWADSVPAGPEVRDPFFVFVLEALAGDSLGVWSGEALRRRVAASGRESRLPLERIRELERRAARPDEVEARRGVAVSRIWRLVFDENLKLPMPYSILGYHPGSLFLSRELVLSEWRLGARPLQVVRPDTQLSVQAAELAVFRLDTGWIVLDADALLDKLLGKKLDDSWTMGFALGRVDGRLQGLGLAYGRKGRKLYGEIDFREDRILPHGRPLALALSRLCRPWTEPPPHAPDRRWQYER